MDNREFIKSRAISAANQKLASEPEGKLPLLALEQGGINITNHGIPLTEIPTPAIDANQEEAISELEKMIKPNEAVFAFETGEKLSDVFGLAKVTGILRSTLFSTAEKEELIDRTDHSIHSLDIQMPFLEKVLGDKPKITSLLAETSAKIDIALEIVGDIDENTTSIQLKAWKSILEEIGNSITPTITSGSDETLYERMVQIEREKLDQTEINSNGKPKERYREKFKRLISAGISTEKVAAKLGDLQDPTNREGRRLFINRLSRCFNYFNKKYKAGDIPAQELSDILNNIGLDKTFEGVESAPNTLFERKSQDELLSLYQRAYTYEVRYRIQSLSRPERGADLSSLLSEEFLRTTFSLNTLRVLNRLHDPEHGIDLFRIREQISRYKETAQRIKNDTPEPEKTERLSVLDEKTAKLLAPIVNKTRELFPHDSMTFLSSVLKGQQAICAGKTNALLPVLEFVQLDSREAHVERSLGQENFFTTHAVVEIDLFKSKLVVDPTNKRNPSIGNPTIDNQLVANSEYMIPGFETYGYFISNENLWSNERIGTLDRIDQNTGKREKYYSSIPYPHPTHAPDKDAQLITSGVYHNLKLLLERVGRKSEAEYYHHASFATNPHAIQTLFDEGYYQWKDGDLSKAHTIFKKMVEYDPDNPLTQFSLASFYHTLKTSLLKMDGGKELLEEALKHASKCIQIWQSYPNAQDYLAEEKSRLVLDEAKKIIQDLQPMFPEKE